MAEFVKVAKEYVRLCESHPNCSSSCPMNQYRDKAIMCWNWTLLEEPEKAEKIIMDWAKENPVKTNRDKFKEVFGFDPLSDILRMRVASIEGWFGKEYKEPKDE